MLRVLHIMSGADAGGISTVVLNYYRWIDRERIHFDIALTSDQIGQNGMLLQELGAEMYRLPLKSEGIYSFWKALRKLLKENAYDAIHVHENETSYIALMAARLQGIKKRYAHAHSTSPYVSLRSEIRRISGCVLNYMFATRVFACGELAGERIFGKRNMKRKKAMVLPNAIDTVAFAFDEEQRRQVREELHLEGAFAVGMVGRLSPQKNHSFALRVVAALREYIPQAKLILVGNGSEEEKIKQDIIAQDLSGNVYMLGRRADVARLYQGFDALVMPSVYEGFPVVAVEAIASGLPVLMSASITEELAFASRVKYISLNDLPDWVISLREIHDHKWENRENRQKELQEHGLDIRDTARMLEEVYLEGD